jgi:Flp pilus assembly protein TadG
MRICAGARFLDGARRLFGDRSGVAALEFALIVPLLLTLYFVTMEAGQAIETNKKVGRAAAMAADLVTQMPEISASQLEDIMSIGEAALQPYNRSEPTITITALEVGNEETPEVTEAWSVKLDGSECPKDPEDPDDPEEATPVPDTLKVKGSFLIRVESSLDYRPVITWAASANPALGLTAAFDCIPMKETYFLRPRRSMTIPCADCG